MAFGLMTKKWGILQRPLTNSLVSIKHLICCIARLHNYCIDERLQTSSTVSTSYSTASTNHATATSVVETTVVGATENYELLPTHILAEMTEAAETEWNQILSEEYPGWSLARQDIVRRVKDLGLKRPVVTRKRKAHQGRTAGASPQGSPVGQGPEQSQSTAIA
jgi:hypothetical protein